MPLRQGRWAGGLIALLSTACLGQDPNLCAACHGAGGNSTTAGVPSISAQPKQFLEHQLILYREGLRVSEQMQPVTKGLKDADIIKLAEHFSKLPLKAAPPGKPDAALMKQGAERAKALRCDSCHGAQFEGQAQIPRLAAQREEYLASEMLAYREGKRPWGDSVMVAALHGVNDADIKALAHFLSRSSPRAPAR